MVKRNKMKRKLLLVFLSLFSLFIILSTMPSAHGILIYQDNSPNGAVSLPSLFGAASGVQAASQTFQISGSTYYALSAVSFYFDSSTGSPKGNATALLCQSFSSGVPSHTTLATSQPFNVAKIPASGGWINFTFTQANYYLMTPNSNYTIVYENPSSGTIDASDYINLGIYSPLFLPPTYAILSNNYWTWSIVSGNTLSIILYGNAFSAISAPSSATVQVDQPKTFKANASIYSSSISWNNTWIVAYQWQIGGSNITGATSYYYTYVPSTSGIYTVSCIITATSGAYMGQNLKVSATVTVNPLSPFQDFFVQLLFGSGAILGAFLICGIAFLLSLKWRATAVMSIVALTMFLFYASPANPNTYLDWSNPSMLYWNVFLLTIYIITDGFLVLRLTGIVNTD